MHYQIPDVSVSDGSVSSPEEVIISNITDSSATISWFTDTPVSGKVKYGISSSELTEEALDVQGSGVTSQQTVHYVRITGLEKKYFLLC